MLSHQVDHAAVSFGCFNRSGRCLLRTGGRGKPCFRVGIHHALTWAAAALRALCSQSTRRQGRPRRLEGPFAARACCQLPWNCCCPSCCLRTESAPFGLAAAEAAVERAPPSAGENSPRSHMSDPQTPCLRPRAPAEGLGWYQRRVSFRSPTGTARAIRHPLRYCDASGCARRRVERVGWGPGLGRRTSWLGAQSYHNRRDLWQAGRYPRALWSCSGETSRCVARRQRGGGCQVDQGKIREYDAWMTRQLLKMVRAVPQEATVGVCPLALPNLGAPEWSLGAVSHKAG
mmetsp:Transcript_7466/g.19159  ORF Transcript_7466/g.19159 Transcript_7466/m.19159 type:complete len:288 (+) Transcript_7466:394-1257(+)